MININSSKLPSIIGAAIILLLSACGGGAAGDGSTSGFTANNTTNTKPQTSSADSITASSSAESNASSAASSIEPTFSSSTDNQSSSSQSSASSVTITFNSSVSTSSSSKASMIDMVAPAMITSASVVFTEYDMVVFSWAAATDNVGVTAYKIYRNQSQIDHIDASDLTYADFNVAPDSTYTYGVSAGDAVGNWSPIKTILAKTQPQPIPPSPASSSSSSSSSSSKSSSSLLSSSSLPSSSSLSSSSISSFSSSSSSSSSSSLSSASSKSSSSLPSSSSLSSSSISSFSSSSSSSLSSASSKSSSSLSSSSASSSSVDSTPPSAPSSLFQNSVSANQVDIGWTPATDNVAVTTYTVYRDNILLSTLSSGTLTYSDKTVQANKLYTYAVEAGDAAGNKSLARKSIFITTPAASSNGDVTLYWAPPTQREDGSTISGAELGGFLIRYKLKVASDYTLIDINDRTATSRIITGLNGDYEFQIAAYDANNLYSTFASLFPK